jgi:hypothetical protein
MFKVCDGKAGISLIIMVLEPYMREFRQKQTFVLAVTYGWLQPLILVTSW